MALPCDWLSQELPELDTELAGRLGLRFCAVPLGNTAIDLVTGVIGTRTGALTQSLRAHGGGFSAGAEPMLSVAAANAATDQIVWPASSTLRGGTAVQQGTLLCLGAITEQVSTRQYLFGSSMNVDGSGMGLRISTGLTGSAGSIMRSKSSSTAVGWSTGQMLGATPGLQTHFFGYAYDSNGVAGTWLGARQGEDWTGGAAFGTGNTNRKALLFTDYDAGSYANTKAVAVGLFLIFDKRLTVEQYQALYDEPRQLFKPLRAWVPVSAAAGGSDFTHAASGGLQFGGAATATYTADFSQASAGGLLFGGAATVSFTRDFAQAGAGGLTFGGAATVALDVGFTHTATGGLQFGGAASATYTADYAATGSGGLTFGGSAAAQIDAGFAVTGSGGLTFGGSAAADFTYSFSHLAAGGLQLGGTAAAVYSANYVAAGVGGLVFGGSADASFTLSSYSFAGSGGLTFGGAASVELILPTVSTSSVGYRGNPRDLRDPWLDAAAEGQVRDKWDAIEKARKPFEKPSAKPDDDTPAAEAAPIPTVPPAPPAVAAPVKASAPPPAPTSPPAAAAVLPEIPDAVEVLAAQTIERAKRQATEETLLVLLAMVV